MPGLGETAGGDWANNAEVPRRFQEVAQGSQGAGPHSVQEEHDLARQRRLKALQEASQRPAEQEKEQGIAAEQEAQVEQQFTEVDAQGTPLDPSQAPSSPSLNALPDEEDVLEAMRDVIDPELGINIVDLGLVYGVTIAPNGLVTLDMTLTSAACPLTDMLEQQTYQVLSTMAPDVQINWVWMPPWGPDRITEDGRDQLRALGFNV